MKFECCISFLLVLLPILCTHTVETPPEENFAFETFLMVQLRNYSNWLVTSNLDPTPVIPDVIVTDDDFDPIWNISGKIWWEVEVDLGESKIFVHLDFINMTMPGEYEVAGEFWSNMVSGNGSCNITAGPTDMFGGPYFRVTFDKFQVTMEGYVDLSNTHVTQSYAASHRGTFEELEAGGNEVQVEKSLALAQNMQFENWSPLAQNLQNYLQEIFDETPLSGIIGSSI